MNLAIVSQHCELEPQVCIKMKSVRNVMWMWHCDDTMRPFFAALKCNILPFVFPPQAVFYEWRVALNEAPAQAALMGMNKWMNEWEHTQVFEHAHRKLKITKQKKTINLNVTQSSLHDNYCWYDNSVALHIALSSINTATASIIEPVAASTAASCYGHLGQNQCTCGKPYVSCYILYKILYETNIWPKTERVWPFFCFVLFFHSVVSGECSVRPPPRNCSSLYVAQEATSRKRNDE